MTIPLFNFPYLIQKLIILQIGLPELFDAAVAFKAFARLVQSVNYQTERIDWWISENGEEDDRISLFSFEEFEPSLKIFYNANIEFFYKIGKAYEDSNERMEAVSSFVISLFKPKEFSVNIGRNVENFKKLPLWKYSRKFRSIGTYNRQEEGIEMSLEDMKFIFEEKEAEFYLIYSKCPVNYKGPIKCETLQINRCFEWVDLANLLSNNCQMEELCFSEHPKNFTMLDAIKAWLNGRNIGLRMMALEGEFEQEEVDEIIRPLNATPTILSKEEQLEQCESVGDCKVWDIMRDDGSRASFHDHGDFLFLFVWNENLLQKHK